jgi:hypothetical protein
MLISAFFEAGCAWVQDDSGRIAATELVVTVPKAPFYIYGPSQPNGPDFDLKKGDLIEVIRGETGYTYGRLANRGMIGYVSNSDLGPYLKPKPTPVAARHRSGNWRQEVETYVPAVEPPMPEGADPLGLPKLLAPAACPTSSPTKKSSTKKSHVTHPHE